MGESRSSFHVVVVAFVFCCGCIDSGRAVQSNNPFGDPHYEFTWSQPMDLASDAEDQPQVVSSSTLYDGCFVSSEALMISGGELSELDTQAIMSDFSDIEDESDDEDDDDDDGHSSMLSNASLKRSKVSAGGNSVASSSKGVDSREEMNDSISMSRQSSQFSKTMQTLSTIRGGGAAAEMGSEFLKRLIVAALVTLVYEAVIGHLLEFIKIVMQTSPSGTSYLDVIRTITKEKGLAGVWDGFMPWGVFQAVAKGGIFGLAHAMALSVLLPLAEIGRIPMQLALTLAGGIGGGFQGYVLSPTLLLKTRVMTDPVFRDQMSIWKTTFLSLTIGFDVWKNEGLGALMKGSNVFAAKRVLDWATRYYFSDLFESYLRARKEGAPLTAKEKIYASLLGGTVSTVMTLPLDVVVAKMQDAKKAGVKVSAMKLLIDDFKDKGVGAYLRGFEARLLHVCFTTVAMKVGNPIVYDRLFGKQRRRGASSVPSSRYSRR